MILKKPNMNSRNLNIKTKITNGDWTLFLDRDGVINRRLVDDYVKKTSEFEFLPGVLDAVSVFSEKFNHVFIVTNQQGVGKGLMTSEDVSLIHSQMLSEISSKGGNIDKVYFCPDLANSNSPNRKPEIGMAIQAQKDFPEVDFSKSIMVGDSKSDMEFGRKAGMLCIFIETEQKNPFSADLVDLSFGSLWEFALAINK